MKTKIARVLSLGLLSAMSLTMALSIQAVSFTPSFSVPKSTKTVSIDGLIEDGEYTLISSYAPTNEDWFISDYGPSVAYASESNPKHSIDLYATWDEKFFYIGVKASCPGHVANTDPVWNGCGVMSGFVNQAPNSGVYDNYAGYDAMSDVLREIAFSVNPDGSVNANDTTGDYKPDENIFFAYMNMDGYDYYEIAYDWSFMDFAPTVGHEFGWGFMYSTPNAAAADGIDWVCFQSDVVNGKLPQTYTKLVLADAPAAPAAPAETEAEVVDTAVADVVATAPQTFDVGVIAAVAAVVSAVGYAVSKKR